MRGQKVGLRAMRLFIDHLVSSGSRLARLETADWNVAAIQLNRSLGFREVSGDAGRPRFELTAVEWQAKSASLRTCLDVDGA